MFKRIVVRTAIAASALAFLVCMALGVDYGKAAREARHHQQVLGAEPLREHVPGSPLYQVALAANSYYAKEAKAAEDSRSITIQAAWAIPAGIWLLSWVYLWITKPTKETS